MMMMVMIWRCRHGRTVSSDSTHDRFTVQPGTTGISTGNTATTGVVVIIVQMSRKGTVGRMAVGTPDGVGWNQVLAVAAAAAAVVDRTGTTVVDLITFATHSEHFSGRRSEQRSWNRNKQN